MASLHSSQSSSSQSSSSQSSSSHTAARRPYSIAVLAGDGIGPEVCEEAVQVLALIGSLFHHEFQFTSALCGGAAYDVSQSHLPTATLDMLQGTSCDAILFGSVGGPPEEQHLPKWQNAEKNCLLGLRKKLNLAVNVRPAKLYSGLFDLSPLKSSIVRSGVDMVIVRELISGIYFGKHETLASGEAAVDEMTYTMKQIQVPMAFAYQMAQQRRRQLTVVDKANVLDCSRLWRRVAREMSKDYPDVKLTFMYIDNAVMQVIQNPSQFDVIVTGNMFGDILSDAASVLPGSLGLMPSASLSEDGHGGGVHLFEPIGGSAPDLAGLNKANPIAQILSAALLLRYSFQMDDEAKCIEQAVEAVLADGYRTGDLITSSSSSDGSQNTNLIGTKEMGEAIRSAIKKIHGALKPSPHKE